MSGHLRKGTVLFRRTSVGWYLVYPFVPRVLTYTSLRQNDDDDDDTVIRICMQIFHFLLFLHCYLFVVYRVAERRPIFIYLRLDFLISNF